MTARPPGALTVTPVTGPAEELHAAAAGLLGPELRGGQVRVVEATGAAVVLGSTEPADHVDPGRAEAAGLAVVRRRSGGGAVLVGPGRCLWIDVVIDRLDPRWHDDVGRAAWWVGDAWVAALQAVGVTGGEVWRGPLQRRPWADRVCFAGLGAGEVTVDGRKVIGLSQRRTRHGALFQCAALLDGDPGELLGVLALDDRERAEADVAVRSVTRGLGADLTVELTAAVLAALGAAPG